MYLLKPTVMAWLISWVCPFDYVSAKEVNDITRKRIFSHYQAENSNIGSNTIYRVDDGADGYIWLSTDVGLYKYNGQQFSPIYTGGYGDIVGSYKTRQNWLILFLYNGKTRAVDLNTHQIINTDSLWHLDKLPNNNRPYLFAFEDSDNLILTKKATKHNGVEGLVINLKQKVANIRMVTDELKRFFGTYVSREKVDVNAIYSAWKHNLAHLQINNNNILFNNIVFDRKKKSVLFDGTKQLPSSIITCVEQDDFGMLIGTVDKGLFYIINGKTNKLEHVLPYPVSSMCKDYLGNIWVSTLSSGIFLFRKSDASVFYYQHQTNPFAEQKHLQSENSKKFNLLYNNLGKILLYEVHQNDVIQKKVTRQKELKILQNPGIQLNIYKGNLSQFYDFSDDYYLRLMAQNRYSYPWKDAYCEGDTLYLLSLGSLQIIYPDGSHRQIEIDRKFNISNSATAQYLDDNNIILGTTLGIYQNTEKLPWLKNATFNRIRKLGNELICCTTEGVFTININRIKDTKLINIISEESFNDINIDSQYLYLSNKRKLLVLEKNSKKIVSERTFLKYTIPFLANNCFVDADQVVFAASNGVFFFPKSNIVDTSTIVPKIHILNSLNNFSVSDNHYVCTYDKHLRVLLKVDILDFSNAPKRIKYRIKKDGEEYLNWTDYQLNSGIELFKLMPGDYSIEFEILCSDGRWSKGLNYELVILPLRYQTWWAKGIGITLLSATLYFSIITISKFRNRKLSRITEEKLQHLELEAQALNAQINPHFIYNAIIPFQDFTIKGESDKALAYVNKFSRLMRGILNNSRKKSISIQEEMQFIKNYLEIQQQRYENSFDYQVNVSEKVDTQLHIPTLFIQPIVENAVEHGVYKLNYRGKITIEIHPGCKENDVVISVSDNGKGFVLPFIPTKNHVLEIIIERLQLLKKKSKIGSIEFKNSHYFGAVVEINLPTYSKNTQK